MYLWASSWYQGIVRDLLLARREPGLLIQKDEGRWERSTGCWIIEEEPSITANRCSANGGRWSDRSDHQCENYAGCQGDSASQVLRRTWHLISFRPRSSEQECCAARNPRHLARPWDFRWGASWRALPLRLYIIPLASCLDLKIAVRQQQVKASIISFIHH